MDKKTKKILITGANGLLGQNLTKTLLPSCKLILSDLHDHRFTNLSGDMRYIAADITDKTSAKNLLEKSAPDIIIHTAAMTDVDGCEEKPELAHKINVEGTANLLSCTPDNCRFVYISTDYVFNGENGPYREEDKPDPIGIYGKTKLEAEYLVKDKSKNSLIIRTIVLYGIGTGLRPYFHDWVIGRFSANKPFKVVDDQTGNTTLASNLADICKVLMENNATGTFHAGGSEIISRYGFANVIADVFGFDKALVSTCKTADLRQKAPRPLQSGFILDKIKGVQGIKLLNVREQIEEYKQELEKNG